MLDEFHLDSVVQHTTDLEQFGFLQQEVPLLIRFLLYHNLIRRMINQQVLTYIARKFPYSFEIITEGLETGKIFAITS